MAGQDRVGEALRNASPLIQNNSTPGPNEMSRQNGMVLQMTGDDPIEARAAWELGVQDGIVDPRLSPKAAGYYLLQQEGVSQYDRPIPPEVQQELSVYRREAATSPFNRNPAQGLIDNQLRTHNGERPLLSGDRTRPLMEKK